ncbi:MAG: HAMP domain-containing histidine kinase [Oscillospiraceae bacterium]|nr:HAMP domain-containing histidine kinase [Oscillospiraceae bacterium]
MESLLLLTALAALFFAVRERLVSRRLLRKLDNMLEQAISGRFREEHFDESLLSALEARMAHWLSSSVLSRQAVEDEKERIQSLLTDLSHQLKTPAANVLLYAQLLAEQPLTAEGGVYTAALEGQAEKLCALIDVLSKLSRLETGILTLHPVPDALDPMLETAAAQFSPRAAEKHIALTLSPSGASAVFDPKWTAEAVCNLLDNAVKYTPSGGRISVEAVAYEMFCRIKVSDTGPGIPEEEQAKIFRRFYRAPNAHDQEGVGVGLYLARQIAQGQGGYLKVDSSEEGGASFSLFLPRA